MAQVETANKVQIFANRLTGARIRAGFTQSELANKAGVSLRAIQIWESEDGNLPRPMAMRSLCEALRVDAGWLLEGVVEQPPESMALKEEPPPYRTSQTAGVPAWGIELVERLGRLNRVQRARIIPALLATVDAVAGAVLDETESLSSDSPAPVPESKVKAEHSLQGRGMTDRVRDAARTGAQIAAQRVREKGSSGTGTTASTSGNTGEPGKESH